MDEKRSPEELLAQLCLEPGFVLVPAQRKSHSPTKSPREIPAEGS